jgi:hypothetical protein
MRTRYALAVVLVAACTTAGGGKKNLLAGDVTAADVAPLDVSADGVDDTVVVIDSDDGEDDAEGDDDVGSDAGPTVSGDTAAPNDVQADVMSPPIGVVGSLLVIQVETSQVQSASVTASFLMAPPAEPTPVAIDGDCKLYATAGPTTPPATPSLDAGALSLTGLLTPMTMTPAPAAEGMVLYTSGLSTSVSSVLGSSPTVVATATGGKDLPGFSVETGVPKTVVVTSPTQGQKLGAGTDLVVTWVKDVASLVRVDLFVYDVGAGAATKGQVILCTSPSDTGALTVKSALLKKLPDLGAGLFGANGYLVVGVTRVATSEVSVSAGKVALSVSRTGGTAAPFDP